MWLMAKEEQDRREEESGEEREAALLIDHEPDAINAPGAEPQ